MGKKRAGCISPKMMAHEDDITVTIVVTAYNVEDVIIPTMQSLVGQDYPHIKIIVVNDFSTDNTAALLAEFAKEHPNVWVLWNERNLGGALAKRRGLREVNSDYFIFCDGDDLIAPNTISECIKTVRLTSADTVIFGFNHLDSATGEYFSPTLPVDCAKTPYLITKDKGFDVRRLSVLSHISPVCLLKTAVHKDGFCDALLAIPYWYDLPTFVSMLAHAKIIAMINEPFYHYRLGREGQSVDSWTHSRRGIKAVTLDIAVQYLADVDWASSPLIRKLQAYKLGRIALNEFAVMRGAGNQHEYDLTVMQFKSAVKGFSATEILFLRGVKFKIFMIALRWMPVGVVQWVFGKSKC